MLTNGLNTNLWQLPIRLLEPPKASLEEVPDVTLFMSRGQVHGHQVVRVLIAPGSE